MRRFRKWTLFSSNLSFLFVITLYVTLSIDLILVVIHCVIGCGGTMSEDLARL